MTNSEKAKTQVIIQLDGCHNCVHMRNFEDYDTGPMFVCLLNHPELTTALWTPSGFQAFVDEYSTCNLYAPGKPTHP